MTSFVLDNSIMMRWLFKDGSPSDLAYANYVEETAQKSGLSAVASSIWPFEVTNVIVRAVKRGILNAAQGSSLIDIAREFPIMIDQEGHIFALSAIYRLANQYGLTAYDASYLELALRLSIPIATLDHELKNAAKAAGVKLL